MKTSMERVKVVAFWCKTPRNDKDHDFNLHRRKNLKCRMERVKFTCRVLCRDTVDISNNSTSSALAAAFLCGCGDRRGNPLDKSCERELMEFAGAWCKAL
jgi:hypothetical protein